VAIAPNGVGRKAAFVEQLNPANYGLARISHRQRGNNTAYRFDDTSGRGSCIYVMDTGINPRQEEFGTRAVRKASFVPGEDVSDLNGHGTHVSGIAGSNTYGAAKNARVYMVKVLNGQGEGLADWFLQGVAFILRDANDEKGNCPRGYVVNISIQVDLTAGDTPADNAKFRQAGAMFNMGATLLQTSFLPPLNVFIAAGNNNHDANLTSPGNAPGACTIGNTDGSDTIFRGLDRFGGPHGGASNYGPIVKLWAPGVNILSTANQNFPYPNDNGVDGPFANFSVSLP
jgi:subtilisin family serine protease